MVREMYKNISRREQNAFDNSEGDTARISKLVQ
jgi:hypothetical protein